ncbi:MAG: TMEM175 family protein [Actinomycetes bacterium]
MDQRAATSTGRIEALSDGVFAVALTILIFDVVAAVKDTTDGKRLAHHLIDSWPTYAAYLIGFLTILVCWINHQRVFHYVTRSDAGLVWINGLQLALVAAVPVPTAILAQHPSGEGLRTATIVYGITFLLMAFSFWGLWRYVSRRGLTDRAVDPERYDGVATIYGLAVLWTVACLAVAAWSVYPALVMWTIMFAVFAFPAEFAGLVQTRRTARAT